MILDGAAASWDRGRNRAKGSPHGVQIGRGQPKKPGEGLSAAGESREGTGAKKFLKEFLENA